MLREKLRDLGQSALGAAMLAYGAAVLSARLTRHLAYNTGRRILRMTAPAGTKELDEAIDYLFGAAIKIKNAVAEGSPGGKAVTLDELLSTVSDGAVKESIGNMWDAIEQITRGGRVDIFDLIPKATEVVLDLLGTLRDALADKRVTIDEILSGISDKGISDELRRALEGIEKVPAELSGLDMWKMIALVQKIAAKLPALLAKP